MDDRPGTGDTLAEKYRVEKRGETGDMIAAIAAGDTIANKYRVDRVLGIGGMGMVVAATHLELEQQVALKFTLHVNDAHTARFMREAKAAARLRSQHICRVSDVGKLDTGAPYIVMELMEGEDFAALLERRGPLPVGEAVDLVLQALDGLAEAHSHQIVHRDLKPANMFIARDRKGGPLVKLLDFGISKVPGSGTPTQTGEVMGSPSYMSPEQLRSSKDVDHRADIWAIGVILYEALSGRTPFDADNIAALLVRVLTDAPKPLGAFVTVPPALEALVMRCLEKSPEMRPQAVADLITDLSPFAGAGVYEPAPAPTAMSVGSGARTPVASMGTLTGGAAESIHTGRMQRSRGLLAAVALGIAVLATVILVVVHGTSRDDDRVVAPAAATPVPPPTRAPSSATPDASLEAELEVTAQTVLDAGITAVVPDAAVPKKRARRPVTRAGSAVTNAIELDEYGIPIQR